MNLNSQAVGIEEAGYPLPLAYLGRTLADPRVIDFLFPKQLAIEIKAFERIVAVHRAHLLTYMNLTKNPTRFIDQLNSETMTVGVTYRVL